MPDCLTPFATQNPLSRLANAARSLTVGGYPCGPSLEETVLCTGVGANALWTLGWAAAIVVIFLPLSARRWQHLG